MFMIVCQFLKDKSSLFLSFKSYVKIYFNFKMDWIVCFYLLQGGAGNKKKKNRIVWVQRERELKYFNEFVMIFAFSWSFYIMFQQNGNLILHYKDKGLAMLIMFGLFVDFTIELNV